MDNQITETVTIEPEKDNRILKEIKQEIEKIVSKTRYDFSNSEQRMEEWEKRINETLHRRYIIHINLEK